MNRANLKLAKIGDKPEIFHSIQGEGRSIGRPSIFIRLTLCNLHCAWCDTDYTWNWVGVKHVHNNESQKGYKKFLKSEQIIKLSASGIANIVSGIACKNIVITGGEPMMQQKELVDLMVILKNIDSNYLFEIETNGTYKPASYFDKFISQYNVSPKLNNSGNSKRLRENSEALKFFSKSKISTFKFVVATPEDMDEILDIIKRYKISCNKVLIMPEAQTKKELNQKAEWIVKLCKQYNFIYSDRLHIRLFGDKRGV